MVAELVMGEQPESVKKSFFSLRTPRERMTFAGWKMDGWIRWVEGLRGAYERRMNRMCRILDDGADQLKTGTPARAGYRDWGVVTKTRLFDFKWPRGGMFVWVRLNFETHPLWQAVGSHSNLVDGSVLATALMLFLTTKPYLVLAAPGMMFSATEEIRTEIGWAYSRLCFAAESEENVDACSHRYVSGVQRFWRIKKVEDLEDILKIGPSITGVVLNDEEFGDTADLSGMYTAVGC
jgi:DNA-binding transcriptional MocR family regulator